jgi:hypothetical protein
MRRAIAVLAACCGLPVAASGASASHNPLIPTPIGVGPRFHPPALSRAVAARRAVAGLRCGTAGARRFGAHLELFARGRVVIVPAGIGIAPPWSHERPQVVSGQCSYAARTTTPTGVIEVSRGRALSLARFFALWGQPLGPRRLAGFTAPKGRPVRAYVGGTRWPGALGEISLRRHAQIVLELGRYIPPHVTFLFAKGL